jgi:hypothetical protein
LTFARALSALCRDAGLRRIVAAAALVAFVVAVVLGAAHAGDGGHDAHCSVCTAAAAVFAGEFLVAPALAEHVEAQVAHRAPPSRVPVPLEPLLQHAPRGPPSAA